MPSSSMPIEVFCSYAHKDKPYLAELEQHLSLLRRQGLITTWHDRQIVAGTDWTQAITTHLERASIVLLLVSADFLASDYCYGIEMQRALQRHQANQARVIPVLLRPVDWRGSPFAHLQVLPTDAKPITTWKNRDNAFADVAAGIRRAIEDLTLLEASGTHAALSPIWNVPFTRNPYFTGRDELLDQLQQYLSPEGQHDPATTRRAALTQPHAITGLGGIGKTQIAVEYAYRSRDLGRYTHTLWINAASEETIIASFVTIADLLPSFPEKKETDQRKLVEAVKRWLERCEQAWLLIFDNADDMSLVRDYLPQQGNGSILLTTRAHAVGALAASIEVETMGFLEGTQLLLRRAQRYEQASDDEINQAGNIVIALDHLPLAIDQAGAYIEETGCSIVDYLDLYQTHRKEFLARRGYLITSYSGSVATTWSLSFARIEQANPAAAELLRLCAFLDPDAIPEEIIVTGAHYLGGKLWPVAADPFLLNQAIEALRAYSLLRRNPQERTLTIHRLVQAVVGDSLPSETRDLWKLRAVLAIDSAFPEVEFKSWLTCERLLPHAQLCAAWTDHPQLATVQAARLLNQTGLYLKRRALYAVAEPLYQRALSIYEQLLDSMHPDTATVLNNLALLYAEQGKYAEAETLFYRALAMREQQFGAEHPSTAASLDNLANLYVNERKYDGAEPLLQRALAIREKQLGPEHPSMAISLDNLALLYSEQGRYTEAEPLLRRAIAIQEQQLGQEHPSTAASLDNLANLYVNEGRYTEAEPLLRRALEIREQQLGPEHPSTATSLNNLALLNAEQGRYAEAKPLYQRALTICEQMLGQGHPHTQKVRENYKRLLQRIGQPEGAI